MSRYVIPKIEDDTKTVDKLRIFVSHSHGDKDLVAAFNENILQLGMGIPAEKVFCTSYEGAGIKSGEQWVERVKEEIKASTICVFIVTAHFQESKTCLIEMGATWVLDKRVIIFTVPPVSYEDINYVYKLNQIETMDDIGLNHFFDTIKTEYPNITPAISVWDRNKNIFLSKIYPYNDNHGSDVSYSKKDVNVTTDEHFNEREETAKEDEQFKQCNNSMAVISAEDINLNSCVQSTFKNLLVNAEEQLRKVSPTLRTVIYNHRYNKSLDISFYIRELCEEEAQKYVIIDENGCEPVYEKKKMQAIKYSLDALETFIDGLTSEEYELLEKRFQTLDCSDLDFWKNVLHISMNYA